MEYTGGNQKEKSAAGMPKRPEPDPRKPLRVSDIAHGLRRNLILIIACTVVGLAIGIVLSIVSYMRGEMSKGYAIKTTIGFNTQNAEGYFTSQTKDPNNNDIHLGEDMIDAVVYVLKSDKMLNEVVDRAGLLGVSTRDINSNLVLTRYNETQIIDVNLYWRSAQEGVKILEVFNNVAPDVLRETLMIGNVSVINDPTARYLIGGSFNITLWGIMMVLGLMVGVGISVLSLITKQTLLKSTDMEKDFGLEVLGVIPEKGKRFQEKPEYLTVDETENENAYVRDCYVTAAQILRRSMRNIEHTCIYITSSLQDEGKTTATAYLGACFAELGYKVLMVDLDTRKPRLGGVFLEKTEYKQTINALYRGESTKKEAVISLTPKLDLLPAMLEKDRLSFDCALLDLIESFKKEYDLVLIDTSPVGRAAEILSLNDVSDACLVVVRFDYATNQEIRDSIWRLDKSGVSIPGCLVNREISFSDKENRDKAARQNSSVRKKPKEAEKSIRQQEWEAWEKEHSDPKES